MAGQDIPINFYVTSIITKSNLAFSTSTLDFKNVYLNQNIILPLTVTNGSFLPQKISFVKIKTEIDIQPNDGFAILLPNESLQFSVNFSPLSVTNYSFDLILYTNYNDKSIIKVIGNGIKSPLSFNKYNLSLRSTSPGEKVVESIIIQNIYKLPICYEFFIPDIRFSFLKVSPFIFELKPLEKCRVEIEYLSPVNILNENAKDWFQKLKCDMLVEESEKRKEKESNNNNNNNEHIKIENDIFDKNKFNNKKNKKDDKKSNDIDNNGNSTQNASELNENSLVKNNEIATNDSDVLKTTFGVFTDFVEDSEFITVENSFGKMKWLQNTKISNEKSNDKELISNKSESIENKFQVKENYGTEKVKNGEVINELKDFNKEDDLIEISDIDIITDNTVIENKIINDSINILAENSKKYSNDNNTNNKTSKSNELKKSNKKNKQEKIKTEIASKIISDMGTNYDTSEIKHGIHSSWSLPVFMKVVKDKNKKYGNDSQILTENLIKNNLTEKSKNYFDDEFNINNDNSEEILSPLFFSIETVVSDPQFTSDIKTVNFGQIAIGKKCLKSVKITNNCNHTLQLITYGTNAVGPFSVLNPLKDLRPQEFKKIVIEFVPTETGYFTEILEFQNREEIGGHRLRITLRAYGVTPYVTLNGLLPPPKAWGTCKNGSGYLDFGNILVNDTVIQNFTVLNQSTFDVDVTLVRAVCEENSELTICGLPVFSIRPEAFLLLPGKIYFSFFILYCFSSLLLFYNFNHYFEFYEYKYL